MWNCGQCGVHLGTHVLSRAGDKKGQVAVWDHQKVYERTVYTMHRALTNQIRFFDAASALSCASASSDGKLKVGGAAAGEGAGSTADRALGDVFSLVEGARMNSQTRLCCRGLSDPSRVKCQHATACSTALYLTLQEKSRAGSQGLAKARVFARAQVFDIETGIDSVLVDLNPGGWIHGVTTEKSWNMCAPRSAAHPGYGLTTR